MYTCIYVSMYIHMTDMPNKTITYLRMYCNGFPIVLHINNSFKKI